MIVCYYTSNRVTLPLKQYALKLTLSALNVEWNLDYVALSAQSRQCQ